MSKVPGQFTQSGFPVLSDYGSPELVVNPEIPGTGGVKIYGGTLKGDVTTIALYVAHRYHKEVEKLQQVLGVWGFNPRKIAGSSTWSNHAGGVAWDLNSARHPYGKKGTYTTQQVRSLRAIYRDVAEAAEWGGEWTGSGVDEMHGQLRNLIANTGAVSSVAKKIREGKLPNVPAELRTTTPPQSNPVPKPKPVPLPPAPSGTHVVKAGETLSGIALKYLGNAARYPEIASLNKIADPSKIYVGQRLTIPGKADPTQPPRFPLPKGFYYGPLEGPARSISGSYKTDTDEMRAGLARWQQRMKDRGWKIKVDGYYGPETGDVARRFQKEKDLYVDGLVGIDTWTAAWVTPIT